mmetsp:Transcript_63557/g.163561  ORF Transcript_63557/g.163561 Transcript_63557/m.163561 type:complete len:254 (+) Transcript_63557:2118-2879(+)
MQGHPRLDPLLLSIRQEGLLALVLHLHELVHDDADPEVHEEHEAEHDPQGEEDHPHRVGLRVTLWLDVRPAHVDVACRVHHVNPALSRGDLEQRQHGVGHVIEVLTQHLAPAATLLEAQRRVLHQRLAELAALAGGLALLPAQDALHRIRVGAASLLAEIWMVLALALAALPHIVRDVGAEGSPAAHGLCRLVGRRGGSGTRHRVGRRHRRNVRFAHRLRLVVRPDTESILRAHRGELLGGLVAPRAKCRHLV